VNDGSKDRTGEICDRLVEELSTVRVVHHARNGGYGAAPRAVSGWRGMVNFLY
jgi:glycosyltransferase involved in cell wall biosynthesis